MANPRFYDPRLFPQQAAQQQAELAQQQQQQQQPAPQPQGNGFHLLEGLGNLVMAAGHFLSGGPADDDEVEASPRRRPRLFGARASKRVGQGPCCRRGTR